MPVETSITRLFGLRVPLVQRMGGSVAGALALSRAGGLGIVNYSGPDDRAATAALGLLHTSGLPFAVRIGSDAHLGSFIQNGSPAPVIIVSAHGEDAAVAATGSRCLRYVASVAEAVQAVRFGADGLLVLTGADFALLRDVAAAMPGVPLCAGIAVTDAAGLSTVLAAGADAAEFDADPADTAAIVATMTDALPDPSTKTHASRRSRLARESQALRANLRRRKSQASRHD